MDASRLHDGSFGSDRLDVILTRVEMEERGDEHRGLISPLMLPHPDDDTDDDAPSARLIGGSEYVRQNLYMVSSMLRNMNP